MIAIILRGPGSAGKSSIIRTVYNRLRALNDVDVLYQRPGLRNKICHVLRIRGKIIGILSIGDNVKEISLRLPILLDYNCEIIICVARKY